MTTLAPALAVARGSRVQDALAGARRAVQRGFTLIELMVTMVIIITLVVVGAVSLNSIRSADADTTANVLASAMRYVSTLAVHYNKTYRLVLDLDEHRWWVETTNSDDPCGRYVPDDADPPADATDVGTDGESRTKKKKGVELELDEEGAVALAPSFAKEEAELLEGEFEPDTTVSGVLTAHHQEQQRSGKVAIYFYPNGQAERAFVWVAEEKEDDGVITAEPEITLDLQALGSVQRHGAALAESEFYREVRD